MTKDKVKSVHFGCCLPLESLMFYIYLIVALVSLFALAGPNLVYLVVCYRLNSKFPELPEETKPEPLGSKKKPAHTGLQPHQTDEHFPFTPPAAAAPTPAEPVAVVRKAQSAAPAQQTPYSLIPTLSLDAIVVPSPVNQPPAVHPVEVVATPSASAVETKLDSVDLAEAASPVIRHVAASSPLDNLQYPAVFRRRPPKLRLTSPLTIRR
jgi:hypothetical protein